MTIKEALTVAHKRLAVLSLPIDIRRSEAEILLAYTLARTRTWLIAHPEERLYPAQEKSFFKLIARRAHHEPIAYLTGTKEFHGLTFNVNKHVLIPRPETEEMIDLMIQRFTFHVSRFTIWDIGTGSGAIAISVKHLFPNTTVIASDTSKRTLSLAQKNAERILSTQHGIRFIQASLLTKHIQKTIHEQRPTQLIILANLPYLPLSDRQKLQKDVVDFEPHRALFTEKEGNALILKLLRQLRLFTKNHPLPLHALFEFDPPQTHTLEQRARELFPHATISVHKDNCGRPRFLELTTLHDTRPSTS